MNRCLARTFGPQNFPGERFPLPTPAGSRTCQGSLNPLARSAAKSPAIRGVPSLESSGLTSSSNRKPREASKHRGLSADSPWPLGRGARRQLTSRCEPGCREVSTNIPLSALLHLQCFGNRARAPRVGNYGCAAMFLASLQGRVRPLWPRRTLDHSIVRGPSWQ